MTDHIDRGLERMIALESMSDREKLYEALGSAYGCGGAVWMPAVEGCPDCVRADMNRHPAYVYWRAAADDYYVCQRRKRDGKGACEHGRFHRAEALEAAVATYVSDRLGDADKVGAHVDAAITREADAMRNPEGSAKAWLDKLAECDRRRAAFQDQQAAGLMTLDELGDRLRTLDEERAVAERELGRLRDAQKRIEELEANKEAVLRMFGTGLLVGIEWFPPNLRRVVYELLATRVTVCGDRTLTIEANLDANPVCHTKDVEEYVEGLRGIEERVSEAGALGTQEWIDLVERELFALRASLSDRTDTEESEMVKMEEEVRSLPEEELDWTLTERLDIPYPVDVEVLDRILARVEEPERLSEGGSSGFTGAPDMSHEPRPEERRGER